jgi:biopolymer transport protein ExbD
MTPILDMVFQLITFFMLVINFKAAETDTSLKLPVVGSARPAENKGQGELLVLNLNADGKLIVRGREEPSIEGFIAKEAQLLATATRQTATHKTIAPGEERPVTVVIRADRTVLVQFLMRVVKACQAQGYRKFDFMVMRQGEPSGGGTP